MLPSCLTRTMIQGLDWLGAKLLSANDKPMHLRIGVRGEEDAYFHLRKLGYVMVARNYRTPRCRGEIDNAASGSSAPPSHSPACAGESKRLLRRALQSVDASACR